VAAQTPDIAILDMQVGSMGGMAITMDLRLDQSDGRLPKVPVLMMLDRIADIHMARRSGADGWTIKPLDSLRLRKAVNEIAAGGCYAEGLPTIELPEDEDSHIEDTVDAEASAEESATTPA
jgi:DNA-binding NarL/FixJ family response regulator